MKSVIGCCCRRKTAAICRRPEVAARRQRLPHMMTMLLRRLDTKTGCRHQTQVRTGISRQNLLLILYTQQP